MTSAPPEDRADSVGRRLWTRFGLSLVAVILVLLSQRVFAAVVRGFVETGAAPIGTVLGYLALGIVSGLVFGLAVVLPARIGIRHPRRALTLAVIPLLMTGLNLTLALTPPGTLPQAIADFTLSYTLGLQIVASVFLGLAIASAFAD